MKLTIRRGLPGTGKTYATRAAVRASKTVARINRDDLREMMFESVWSGKREQIVIDCEKAIAAVLIKHQMDVIVDDCNISQHHLNMWLEFAADNKVHFEADAIRMDLDAAVRGDSLRAGRQRVGKAVIHRMALMNGLIDFGHKKMVLVDIDGTISCGKHREHLVEVQPKQWQKYFDLCHLDSPIDIVVRWVRELSKEYTICLVSGRPDSTQFATMDWLAQHEVPYDYLFMRASSDGRPDVAVKTDFLNKLPREKIEFVLDDRPVVVREVWRKNGIKVYPVRGAIDEF